MNINGKNGLACMTEIDDLPQPSSLRPLPGLPVIRDLIVDMTQFFKQYHSIKPFVVNEDAPPGARAPAVAGRARGAERAVRMHPVRLLLDLLPVVLVEPGQVRGAGRACCRPTASWPTTRDEATSERLDNLEDPYRLFRCHSIMNCVDACPKGLNPTRAIGKIKEVMVKRAV
jgi:succinate dehydrogenase / fumarate reductase, iron-sulfur subunit